jgi:transcriptional regulator with XRE-family HTH domain
MIRLKQLREERGFNQHGLAMQLHVSQATISAYETGARAPDLDMLYRLSRFFQVSVDYLIGISERRTYTALPFSDQEAALIERFRLLDSAMQQRLLGYCDALFDISRTV